MTTIETGSTLGAYHCRDCGAEMPVEASRVVCDCGGLLDLPLHPVQRPAALDATFPRARTWVADWAVERASLGSPTTPLVQWHRDADVWLKCDMLLPTGSFKDRGAQVVAGLALELGVGHVVVDSSGNAAASIAAHAARAGLECTVFVPEGASPGKLRQALAHGARLEVVQGSREEIGIAARDFARRQHALYGGHGTNPHFHDGTKSWIYEVLEKGPEPDTLVLPVGSGSLLLGILRGIEELATAGWITTFPRILIAQAVGYAGLAPPGQGPDQSHRAGVPLAEGIAIRHPARGAQILQRLVDFDATVCIVEDAEILDARRELARGGFHVEPTSAAAWAAWRRNGVKGRTVVALTGHGLKALE